MENTKIEWAKHTFNPWIGCTKISVGPQGACEHCYAETRSKRVGEPELWQGQRRRTTAENWRQPLKWDKDAGAAGERARVFCASLADVFDNVIDPAWRVDLFRLIAQTEHLDWLLLTKRIGNARAMLNDVVDVLSHGLNTWDELPWPNVWIGSTIATQPEADRDIDKLLDVPARLHFLSMEPLLGEVDLWGCRYQRRARPGMTTSAFDWGKGVDWVIVGGESGGGARSMVLGWAKHIVRDCKAAGVPVFVKQLGAKPTNREGQRHFVKHHKGADMAEWPEELRVREFPQ